MVMRVRSCESGTSREVPAPGWPGAATLTVDGGGELDALLGLVEAHPVSTAMDASTDTPVPSARK